MPSRVTRGRRYQNSDLRNKLASEYVLGTQTLRVRRRLETLIQSDPSWWEHIEQWQNHLSGLNPTSDLSMDTTHLRQPPKRVWRQIANGTFNLTQQRKGLRWWWLPMGMAMSLVVGVLIQPVLVPIHQPLSVAQIRPVNYLAMMSSESQQNHFALVAYQGNKPGQSSIRLQLNLGMEEVEFGKAVVWMRDKTTGELALIDSLQNISNIRYMSPTEWKLLKNSSELLVTANLDPNSTLLYRGDCIELGHNILM